MLWITAAAAQAGEAAKAAADAGDVLLQYKVLGAFSVLLVLAVAFLFWMLTKAWSKLSDMLEKAITVAEASRAGLAASAKASEDVGKLIGTLTTVIQGLAREVEGDERANFHGINGLATGQQGIATRLEKLTDRLAENSETVGKLAERIAGLKRE